MSRFGIDLGTANTIVCHHHRGIVMAEPSVMVVRTDDRGRHVTPLMLGAEARQLMGRCPVGLSTVRPLRDGVIVDLEAARAYIDGVLARVTRHSWQRIRPHAVIGVPAGATALERRGLVEAADDAGIHHVRLLPEPIAGALGCGMDPLEPRARMVIDIGGGTSEVTVFCYGGVLSHRSCRVAGDELTLALFQYLRGEHQLVVGEVTAENVKCQASVDPNTSLIAQGMDAATGRPRLVTLGISEVVDALRPTVDTILATLVNCLEDLPPQAANDILEDGVVAFGGGSLFRGFDKLLEDTFAFPVRVAERPLFCVAEGAAMALSREDVLRAFDGELVQSAVA
jgi:rod shape-determining protein MreB